METTGALARKLEVQSRLNSGANWFFWIAGLSMVNAVIAAFEGGVTFVVGLGATLIVDAFAMAQRQESANPAMITAVALVIDAFIAGFFVLFGVFARRRRAAAFIIGMILYAADAALLALFQEWFCVAFHALALWFLFGGLKACRDLPAVDADLVRAVAADAAKPAAAPAPDAPTAQ